MRVEVNMNCSFSTTKDTGSEDALAEFSPPKCLQETKEKIVNFVHLQFSRKRKVVVVTSGGTAVPLEHKTVRFIDNFSTGTRGSAAAEYFLQAGYAVIFIHRRKTLMPFRRHLDRNSSKGLTLLDMFQLHTENDGSHTIRVRYLCTAMYVDQTQIPHLSSVLTAYQSVKEKETLLCVEFVTLCDYLHYLKVAAEAIQPLGRSAMIFLAAAVADFYVPGYALPEHKIQSANGPPIIQLRQVPKMLGRVAQQWAEAAFVVSFKLETDHSLLVKKAREALEKYKHQVVIANLLESRRTKLEVITAEDHCTIVLSEEELTQGGEVEEKLVSDLIQRHCVFSASTSDSLVAQ